MSLEIKNGTVTLPTRRSFLKVFYNVCQIKKKHLNFEQYYRIHVEALKIAVCETTSETVLDEAIDFGYTQKLQRYDPETHQAHPPSKHPFWQTK